MRRIYILLAVIVILAAALRFYSLGSIPPSISWDEAAVGYNGFSIANFGRDEYGKIFPVYFRSFADDKHPVHIYLTALSVKLLGLSEFSTRFPSALFGIFNVVLIFFLARVMFSSNVLGLIVSLFLAISPYNIHFSRFNHEANFALFFFMLGLTLFYSAIKKNIKYLPLSFVSFGVAFLTYHPSKIVVPVIIFLLSILYSKQLLKNIRNVILSGLVVAIVFSAVVALNPALLGIARVNQTSLGLDAIRKTPLFAATHNDLLGRVNLTLIQYTWHFSPQYLFMTGDDNPRLADGIGQFYPLDVLFLVFGVAYLLYKRSKVGMVLLAWALLAPVPSALVAEAPHAARAMFMMGSWNLIAALGVYSIASVFRKPVLKAVIYILSSLVLFTFLFQYLSHYGEYAKEHAIDWQYGMKQAVGYVKDHPEYPYVFMTNVRSQPYIFFLYYLQTPLPEFLDSVTYNRSARAADNTVSSYGKFYFDGFNPGVDLPNGEALYILTPSEYDGLMHRSSFKIKKVIYYPNGTDAYYIVSIK